MKVARVLRVAGAIAMSWAVAGGPAVAKDLNRLRLGTAADDPPGSSVRADGTLEGFDIELAADICQRLKAECSWERVDFADLIPALQGGKIDVAFMTLAITPKRRETIEFSMPIVGNAQGVLARTSSSLAVVGTGDAEAMSLDDPATSPVIDVLAKALRGKTVGTDAGGARIDLAQRYFPDVVLRTFASPEEARRALLDGQVDAGFGRADDLVGPYGAQLQRVGPWFTGGVLGPGGGFGLRKTDADLKAKLDEALKAALADGTIKRLHMAHFRYWVPPP